MNSDNHIINQDSLIAGDIILCWAGGKKEVTAKVIKKVTGSKYKHAAICLNKKNAAESDIYGVKKDSIKNIIQRYTHVAIFRQPDAWNQDSVKALNLFIDTTIKTGAKYNFKGLVFFSKNKKKHNEFIYETLNSFFKQKFQPEDFKKESYFCSELVVNCLIATGFISPSAAVFYKGDTFSPVDLGKDPTFGTFLGFIISDHNYQIPETDDFYYSTSYSEIYDK